MILSISLVTLVLMHFGTRHRVRRPRLHAGLPGGPAHRRAEPDAPNGRRRVPLHRHDDLALLSDRLAGDRAAAGRGVGGRGAAGRIAALSARFVWRSRSRGSVHPRRGVPRPGRTRVLEAAVRPANRAAFRAIRMEEPPWLRSPAPRRTTSRQNQGVGGRGAAGRIAPPFARFVWRSRSRGSVLRAPARSLTRRP